jgi:nucleoside phosphorylase
MRRTQKLALTLIAAWASGSWLVRVLIVLAGLISLGYVAAIALKYFSIITSSDFGPAFLVPIIALLWAVVFIDSLRDPSLAPKSQPACIPVSGQQQPHRPRTVLVVTALQEEMDAVLDLLPNGRSDWREYQIDEGYFYYEREIENNCRPFSLKVTSQAQPGPTYATAHTTMMLKVRPDILFMTGICAGNQRQEKDLQLGDIIIADMAFQYETGKHVDGGFNPEIECSNLDPVTLQWLKDYCATKKGVLKVDGKDRKLYVGPFATGSAVVSTKEIFANLEKRERKVIALDMEAYSVLKAAEISNQKLPTIVVKGVSDFADPEKHDKAHKLAAKGSAKCMLEIARRFVSKLPANPVEPISANVVYPISLPIPANTYGDRLRWRALLQWPQNENWHFGFAKDFETGEYDESSEYSGLEFYELGGDKRLLEVTVGYGAYNGTYRYYFLDERKDPSRWKEVLFRSLFSTETDQIQEAMSPEIDGNAWFDPETSRITTFFKGRGPGDIGQLVTYAFRDGETELISFRQKLENDYATDDKEGFIDPEKWPEIDINEAYPELKFGNRG